MARILFVVALAATLLLGCTRLLAQDAVTVPAALEPWVPWVLHGQEYRQCPAIVPGAPDAAGYACAWPSVLRVEAGPDRAVFRQTWELQNDGWIPLPGDVTYWPERFSVDGEPATVALHDGMPSVWLEAGVRRIEGELVWPRRPGRLAIPDAVGVVDLAVDGRAVAFPQRDDGRLWLGERPRGEADAASIRLRVFRRLEDGSPVMLRTRLLLDVAGPAREAVLGRALPAAFAPTALRGELPMRLEPGGELRVQVRPGSWVIDLVARATELLDGQVLASGGNDWPDEEIWLYAPQPRIRASQFEGGSPVDPAQAGVPAPWVDAAAYVLRDGDPYRILERSRGRGEEEQNRLRLSRRMWLDFDGDGFLALDRINGTMTRDWRLDTTEPYRLRHAAERGETLLITEGAEAGVSGVELRGRDLQLLALSSIGDGVRRFPVAGWAQNLDSVSIELNLPPNRRLLAARGADVARGAWVSGWTLLDIFIVLLVSVAAGRLLGWPAAGLALVTMALVFLDARGVGWALLNLLAAIALVRVAPAGRLGDWARHYRLFALVLAFVVALPFVAQQARLSLYPQLENHWLDGRPEVGFAESELRRIRDGAPAELAMEAPATETVQAMHEKVAAKPALPAAVQQDVAMTGPVERYAPGTVLQSGPGIPNWSWNRYRLEWNGPVSPAQQLSLLILDPIANVAWRLGAIVGLAALLAWAAFACFGRRRALATGRSGAAAVMLLAASLAGPVPDAVADIPDQALLDELARRLTAAPECAPDCAQIGRARVRVDGDYLEIELFADAMTDLALPVPSGNVAWIPRDIAIDDVGQRFLLRRDGIGYLRTTRGSHRVRLSGPLAAVDEFEIAFPLVPRRIVIDADGWEVAGAQDQRMTAATLRLQRRVADAARELEASVFPPFVRIRRHLDMGVEWRLWSRVDRIAPATGAIDLKVPLLAGETVLTDGFEVRDGEVAVALGEGQRSAAWESSLSQSPAVPLRAAEDRPWSEVWQVRIGAQWRVRADGMAPAALPPGSDWVLEFYPRPGETLELAVTRPAAADGRSFAVDSLVLAADLGARAGLYDLTLRYRSTRASEHSIGLPPDALLESVRVDGDPRPLQLKDGKLLLPVVPGAHEVALRWREEQELGMRWRLADVDPGAEATNVRIAASIPENRWVLWASGPALGPAVLYWSELAVFVLVALGLGAIPGTPLKRRDWILLGLGLSTVSWGLMVAFVLWVFAIAWRGRGRPSWERSRFNLLQLLLAGFSVIVINGLVMAIPSGLLAAPDMHITGAGSYGNALRWFQDQTTETLPTVSVVSLPLWVYKGVILGWALWLSFALMRWLPWGWRCWSEGGYWQGRVVAGGGPDAPA